MNCALKDLVLILLNWLPLPQMGKFHDQLPLYPMTHKSLPFIYTISIGSHSVAEGQERNLYCFLVVVTDSVNTRSLSHNPKAFCSLLPQQMATAPYIAERLHVIKHYHVVPWPMKPVKDR